MEGVEFGHQQASLVIELGVTQPVTDVDGLGFRVEADAGVAFGLAVAPVAVVAVNVDLFRQFGFGTLGLLQTQDVWVFVLDVLETSFLPLKKADP